MTEKKYINEKEMVQMYLAGVIVKDIMRHFNIGSKSLYQRLKANGIKSNRKFDILWTKAEDEQLIAAKAAGKTGSEVYDMFENRIPTSVKSRVQKLRIDKRIR